MLCRTGSGGYLKARPKWAKAGTDLLDKGIEPETMNWPDRCGLDSSGLAEPWTLYQGSAFGRTSK